LAELADKRAVSIPPKDSLYINHLRGASILRVVFAHLGLISLFPPYTSYFGAFLSVLFFCSGYVTSFLYAKRKSLSSYYVRRLSSIVLPFYFVYSISVAFTVLVHGRTDHLSVGHFIRFLFLLPESGEMPFPVGQIWFLRILLFCVVVSPLVFWGGRRDARWILVPVALALILASARLAHPVHRYTWFFGYNLFRSVVFGSFFFLGAFMFRIEWRKYRMRIAAAMFILIAVAVLVFPLTSKSLRLGDHAYAPNLYYYPLAMAATLFFLVFVDQVEWVIAKVPGLSRFLIYCSKHSYGIYLWHSFWVVFAETRFGWLGIANDPIMAVKKIFFVVVFSLASAWPTTWVTTRMRKPIRKLT
jgi:peptidoglycan/LPS O-acetylase OafA/YrhL